MPGLVGALKAISLHFHCSQVPSCIYKKVDLCPIKILVAKLRKFLKFCNSVKTTQLDSDILIMRNSISNAARPGLVKALR